MGLDLQALSISSVFTSILNFFKSQENNSKWKDLTTGAEGVFFIRMLSNVLSNISYRVVTASRENFLSTANLLSSALGMAVTYGYSANRGRNQRRLIQLKADNNYILPRFTVVGSYDSEHDIILLEEAILKEGEISQLKVTVGKIKEFSFLAGTNKFKCFSQYIDNISEDFMLYVDNIEVPTSNKRQDLIHNQYLVSTNPSASVDIMYNNNAGNATYSYGTESTIRMRYVELEDVPQKDFDEDMFNYGILGDVLTINDFIPFEDIDNIKNNAPLQHCTEGVVRSKVDYTSRAKELVGNIKETAYTPLTPSYTLMTYLKDDSTLLSSNDKETLLEKLKAGERLMGTLLPDIIPAQRELINLDIYLELNSKFKDINEIKQDINNLISSNFEIKLAQSFNIYDLERLLESLTYVFRARVSFDIKERTNTTLYNLGEIIKKDNNYYKASKILGLSGSTEPIWNIPLENSVEVDSGLETNDGAIIWRCYKKLDVVTKIWESRGKYALGDYIVIESYPNYMFKCVDIKKYSATIPPDVTVVTAGDFIEDGSIIWVCKTTNISVPNRENSTLYRLGDSVNIGGATFECVGYIGCTASSCPIFEQTSYTVDSVTSHSLKLNGNCASYFSEDDKIKAVTDLFEYIFIVNGVTYDAISNLTTINVVQNIQTNKDFSIVKPTYRGTKDGEILWEIVPEDEDFNEIQYGWNVYNSFAYQIRTGSK